MTSPVYSTSAAGMIGSAGFTNGVSGNGVAVDAFSNVWQPNVAGLYEVQTTPTSPTPPTNPITGFGTPSSAINDNATTYPNFPSIDGSGNVWIPSSSSVSEYTPGTSTLATYAPCYAPAGATTCSASFNFLQRSIPDSTGSLWIVSAGNGMVYQMLGTASPAWPQASYTHPGVMPQ